MKIIMEIPFTIYYRNGKVIKATSSIQTKDQVKAILNKEFFVSGLVHDQLLIFAKYIAKERYKK
jgi:hypothetical protein